MAVIPIDQAASIVSRLSRTINYPRDERGLEALARGLARAANSLTHARAIVARCAELSEYCPTDHDLLTVGREIDPPPREPSWTPDLRSCAAGRCDGRGWAQVFFLVSQDGRYTRHDRITAAEYRDLVRKVDGKTQRVYETVEPCACRVPASSPAQGSDGRTAAAGGDDGH